LAIVLSVLLRYTDSDYPFGIFKLFLVCPDVFVHALNRHRNTPYLSIARRIRRECVFVIM